MRFKPMMLLPILMVLTGAHLPARAQEATAPALSQFDEDVARCRRVLRDYCAIVQDMTKADKPNPAQQARGLAFLKDARGQWRAVQKKYADLPPAEYARDKAFKARLRDFANALEDMEKALAAGDARRSFKACGFGCGLFVGMHEQNGLDYALDKLFHLRKDIKTAQALMKTRGLNALRGRIGGMLQKRDAVQLAPPPFPSDDARLTAYQEAAAELSQALDRLAQAIALGDAQTASAILKDGVRLVNKPYGIAL